jgi:exodeoxyribonuclease VII small subunit
LVVQDDLTSVLGSKALTSPLDWFLSVLRVLMDLQGSIFSRFFMSKPKSNPNKDHPLPETYELAVKELEDLVRQMEAAQLPLDELLVAYERGSQLLAFCREKLSGLEDQIKRLDDGQLKPLTGVGE